MEKNKIVKDFKHACKILGRESLLPDVSKLTLSLGISLIAYTKIATIIEAKNKLDGFIIDYTDSNQKKWQPWWWQVKADAKHKSGFGFSVSLTSYGDTHTSCGSRLCCGSQEAVEDIMKRFEKLFIDYLL
jgi:hypothetical protein